MNTLCKHCANVKKVCERSKNPKMKENYIKYLQSLFLVKKPKERAALETIFITRFWK